MKNYFQLVMLMGSLVGSSLNGTGITCAAEAFSKKEDARREYGALAGRALSIYLEMKEPELLEMLSDSELEELGKKVSHLLEGWYPGTDGTEYWELDETALLVGAGSLFDGSLEYRIAMDICYALKKRIPDQPVKRGYHWFY